MDTMRDIKRRITSVKNTQKITKAMKMVAAAKLRRAQEKAEVARPFFEKTREILLGVAKYTNEPVEHPLLEKRDSNKHLYVVINSDRGLCGAYNARVVDKTLEVIKDGEDAFLLTIGRNARDFFARRDYNIMSEYIGIGDYPDYRFAQKISDEIISFFTDRIIGRVTLVYTHFYSAISQEARAIELLPVEPVNGNKDRIQTDYLYEPSVEAVFDILLPRYINNIIYSALLEAKASQFGAEMTAMDAATDNAGELIDELTLSYNRVRQAAITKEISEIVGGAEALK